MSKLPFKIELPEDSQHINMIIYGDTGAGKTHLCGTAMDFIDTSPALLVDFEGGTKTLHGRKIDITRPSNWKEIQDIYEFFLYDNNKYKCVIIDPLTELQKKHSMGFVMGELTEDSKGKSIYTSLEEAAAPTRQDWLRSGEQMRKVIRAFRDLAYLSEEKRRVHVIMTALEKYDEKKNTICPQLPGTLGLECGAMVDILVRLSRQSVDVTDDKGNVKSVVRRHLLTDYHVDEFDTKYLAKNRGNRLGISMWEPTIAKILGVWKEQKADEGKI